jgi:nitroimidazol reductase NimA-like FMN-containing flavoprotein (pyridoxamine 5'-phosphate oxidase superfamily)
MIDVLTETQARELLSAKHYGRLGCCVDGEPYVVPINYLFDGDSIYIHSKPGRKINALRANPRACLQVDEVKNPYNWRSVIAFGRYEEVSDEAERERTLASLFNHLPHVTPVESKMTSLQQTIVFRLRVDEVTGVCERW